MGPILLVLRLVTRDLRRRRTEAILLLLAIAAATTTLTMALVLHGVTSQPYQRTRAATAGPDVVAGLEPPRLTQGSWMRGGGVVLERTFADALGVRTGDRVTLNGHRFRVAGIAVTAAIPPYPDVCSAGCAFSYAGTHISATNTGLIWLTQGKPALWPPPQSH
jgi:hypothetical protein